MKTSKKIEIARGLLHSGKEEVALLVAILWEDSMVIDYVAEHHPEIDIDAINIKVLVCHAVIHFMTRSERTNGDTYWHWDNDAPSELRVAFREFTELDDWRYEKLRDFADAYIEDQFNYVSEVMVDIYTHDLMSWLRHNRTYYVEQAEREWGVLREGDSFFDLLQRAQFIEIQELGYAMESCLEDFVDEHIDMDTMLTIVNKSREALEAV